MNSPSPAGVPADYQAQLDTLDRLYRLIEGVVKAPDLTLEERYIALWDRRGPAERFRLQLRHMGQEWPAVTTDVDGTPYYYELCLLNTQNAALNACMRARQSAPEAAAPRVRMSPTGAQEMYCPRCGGCRELVPGPLADYTKNLNEFAEAHLHK